jgi:hypothetical protein
MTPTRHRHDRRRVEVEAAILPDREIQPHGRGRPILQGADHPGMLRGRARAGSPENGLGRGPAQPAVEVPVQKIAEGVCGRKPGRKKAAVPDTEAATQIGE